MKWDLWLLHVGFVHLYTWHPVWTPQNSQHKTHHRCSPEKETMAKWVHRSIDWLRSSENGQSIGHWKQDDPDWPWSSKIDCGRSCPTSTLIPTPTLTLTLMWLTMIWAWSTMIECDRPLSDDWSVVQSALSYRSGLLCSTHPSLGLWFESRLQLGLSLGLWEGLVSLQMFYKVLIKAVKVFWKQ